MFNYCIQAVELQLTKVRLCYKYNMVYNRLVQMLLYRELKMFIHTGLTNFQCFCPLNTFVCSESVLRGNIVLVDGTGSD